MVIAKVIRLLIVLAIIALVNFIVSYIPAYLDLTEDKRFSLSKSTIELIQNQDEQIFIQILLDGEFPAGFKRLRSSTLEILNRFNSINGLIDYDLINPSDGSIAQINAMRTSLSEKGIFPTNLMVRDGDQMTEKLIYPFALVKKGDKEISVNLLEPSQTGASEEQSLNNSVSLLEYKLSAAIHKMSKDEKPNIVFTEGQGELLSPQTAKLFEELKPNYDLGRIHLDSVVSLSQEIDLLLVVKPTREFTIEDQFKLDQYLMHGGKIIWMIDQFNVNLDSINRNNMFVPEPIEHKLDDLLFKYGVRISKDLVLDLENSRIPQVIGRAGGKAQTSLFPWFYHPLVASKTNHPVANNIDRTNLKFPSSIDTLQTKANIAKTILLSSSNYSRRQIYPMRISFDILKIEPDVKQFNKKQIPLAVLLEGQFDSAFENRVSEKMKKGLQAMGQQFKSKGLETKQLVVSDGDLIKNLYNPENNNISSLGYNQWEQRVFHGNKEFIINAVEYMLDDAGLIESRSKEVKLRLLDRVKASEEKLSWQLFNILLPVLMVLGYGLLFNFLRKKKYASK